MAARALRGVAVCVVVMALGGVAAVAAGPAGATAGKGRARTALTPAVRYGIVPVHHRGTAAAVHPDVKQAAFPCEVTCGDIRMSYFDGPIVSNAQVEDVFWGSGTYTSGAGPGQEMPTFFDDLGASAYWAMLTEYNPDEISGGTVQAIGPVSSLGETTITPAAANDGSSITDQEEQNELVADFNDGALPAPKVDSQGQVTTDYALFMPNGKTLYGPPGAGEGGVEWCAYHNTLSYDGLMVPYMVLPAFVAGNAYSEGCGGTPTLFGDFTSTVSHETVESTTDPAVGLDTQAGYAYPVAWADNDDNVGEIADACDTASAGDYGTVDGFDVQPIWSNVQGACVVGGGMPDLLPAMGTTASGEPVDYSVTNNAGTDVTSSTTLSVTTLQGGAVPGATCTGDACTVSSTGTYLVRGAVSGGGSTDAAVLTVTPPQAQSITFTSVAPTDATVDGTPYLVTATGGGSGNPVILTIDGSATAVCSISGGSVSFTGIGTCTVDANQAGGDGFAAAAQQQQRFSVGPDPADIPTIKSFTPTSGPTGTTVTITGTNLSGATVTFDGVTAAVTEDKAKQIVATVPAGAKTGTIAVSTLLGGTATSKKKFKVTK